MDIAPKQLTNHPLSNIRSILASNTHVHFMSRLSEESLAFPFELERIRGMRELFCRLESLLPYIFPSSTYFWVMFPDAFDCKFHKCKNSLEIQTFLFPFGVPGAQELDLNYRSLLIISSLHGSLGLIIPTLPD
ncbi:hypothetical protein NPIL_585221 [Nephila pilipes]|uniref:Uncharacterized protein n=1 Tax=Nephila pilipes TaxID=299642 RepID=A0A8X6TV96_NEPPI|nr:hypothetical protein NPIL_585221 [Nephila pilipes]